MKTFMQFLEQKSINNGDSLCNEGIGDIIRGIGGFVGGMRRGWGSGKGSDDLTEAEANLKKQFNVAYSNYGNSLQKVAAARGYLGPNIKKRRQFLSLNTETMMNFSMNALSMDKQKYSSKKYGPPDYKSWEEV